MIKTTPVLRAIISFKGESFFSPYSILSLLFVLKLFCHSIFSDMMIEKAKSDTTKQEIIKGRIINLLENNNLSQKKS